MRRNSGQFQALRTGLALNALSILVLIAGTVAAASAQDFRGTITGQINDSSGGRLPGAVVTATNTATNVDSSTTTNGEGDTRSPISRPGSTRSPSRCRASRSWCAMASRCASAIG